MDGPERLPPAVRVINEAGTSPYVLLCEHASRFIPASYGGLGLGEEDLSRHIAWDIGAAKVAFSLAALLDAPLVLAGYSRLLIDLNESTVIPGNQGISDTERAARIAQYFEPFHARVREILDERSRVGAATVVIGVHSFTPVYKGIARPWHAGILYRKSRDFGHNLATALGGGETLHQGGEILGFATMLIAFSTVFIGIKRHRDVDGGGVIRFWPAVGLGLGISLVASLFACAWSSASRWILCFSA